MSLSLADAKPVVNHFFSICVDRQAAEDFGIARLNRLFEKLQPVVYEIDDGYYVDEMPIIRMEVRS